MILRKPFAFFIKHFKMFHFVMLLFMIYVMYSSSSILSFLNEYLNSTLSLINHDVITTLYGNLLYISIIFIFIITIVILVLLLFKGKPVKFYIFNIITYIFTLTIIIISKNILSTLEITLVEVRTIKLIQDLILMTIIVQAIASIMMAVRATGFNIKKFDFAKDLEELDIRDEDSEEFEVNLEFESDKYLRKVKKIFRYIKYIYVENKYLFSILASLLIGIICIIIYLNQTIYNKVYKENETLTTKDFYFSVVDTFVTNKDFKGNIIDNDYSFVISRIKLRSLNKDKILKTAQIALHVNDHNLYPTTDYKNEFSDLGVYYNGEEISKDFKDYLLIYKIPNSYVDSKMQINYFDTNLKTIKIKISPNKIDDNIKEFNYNIGDNIILENSILKNSSITITSFEFGSLFDNTYNYCISNNECILSHEIIKPKLDTNYDKALLKVSGNYELDENLSIVKPQKLYYLLEKFGSIIYNLDGKEYRIDNLTQVLPNKKVNNNIIYFEVPSSLMTASEIKFKIKVRNMSYVYTLK